MKEVILTPDGFKKLQEEIEFLSTDKRRDIANRIREAREFGDIAENAEYDSAKNEQAHLEARIALLEERLKSARVVTKKEIKSGEVSGARGAAPRRQGGKTVEYHIVGSAEADPPRTSSRTSHHTRSRWCRPSGNYALAPTDGVSDQQTEIAEQRAPRGGRALEVGRGAVELPASSWRFCAPSRKE